MMQGQWWRLITAGFLHGGVFHILMNSWVLFDLGAEVEELYGTSRLIVFYFVSTVTGFWTSSHIGMHVSVGSSAGIFGLIGAMLAFGVSDRSALGSMVKSLYMRWVIYGLVLSFLPGVDFWAHVGGLGGGFVAGWLASTPQGATDVERAAAARVGWNLDRRDVPGIRHDVPGDDTGVAFTRDCGDYSESSQTSGRAILRA